MKSEKRSLAALAARKKNGPPLCVLTAYDALMARLLADCEQVDMILVGDSLGNVVLGYDSTVPVTIEDMVHHCRAVRRGAPRQSIVADMPFLSYQISAEQAIANAGRLIKEGGADAVKIEATTPALSGAAAAIANAGIPVMGHIGLTPQSAALVGDFKVRGREPAAAMGVIALADRLVAAGCFALVLECVPAELAAVVTRRVVVPTIGIGAGADCDGQVLVTPDLLGMTAGGGPRFVKRYAALAETIVAAVRQFAAEVRAREFPGPEHASALDEQALHALHRMLRETDGVDG